MIVHLQASSEQDHPSKAPVLLCVDDSTPALLARAHLLSRHGYTVIAINTPVKALGILWKHTVDAIITDYEMPGMDGGQFAAYVKKGARSRSLLLHSGCLDIPASAKRYMDAIAPKGQPVERFLAEVDRFIAQMCAGLVACGRNLDRMAA